MTADEMKAFVDANHRESVRSLLLGKLRRQHFRECSTCHSLKTPSGLKTLAVPVLARGCPRGKWIMRQLYAEMAALYPEFNLEPERAEVEAKATLDFFEKDKV